MKVITYISIIICVVMIPLDNFYLKWITSNPNVTLIFSQLPDLIILGTFTLLFVSKFHAKKNLKVINGQLDIVLIVFILFQLLHSISINSNVFNTLVNLKATFRYILLIYILININFSKNYLNKILNAVSFILILEVSIGLIQVVISPEARMFFLPMEFKEIGQEFASISKYQLFRENIIFGTMDKPIEYSLLLFVALVFVLTNNKLTKLSSLLYAAILFFLIYWSGSRAVFLVSILLVIFNYLLLHSINKFIIYTLISIPLLAIAVALLIFFTDVEDNYVFFAFSKKYWEIAKMQRLGIIFIMAPEFFFNSFITILLGFSGDISTLAEHFSKITNRPLILKLSPGTIEDVYWVAFLYYYGVTGLLTLIYFVVYFFKKMHSNLGLYFSNVKFDIIRASLLLLSSSILLNFFMQSFKIRTFSFFLWLLVGMSIYSINQYRNEKIKDTQ